MATGLQSFLRRLAEVFRHLSPRTKSFILIVVAFVSHLAAPLCFAQPTTIVVVGQVQSSPSNPPPPPTPDAAPAPPPNPNTGNFAVINFSNPSSPTVVEATPSFMGLTAVDCTGVQAAVGNQDGDQVDIFDLSNPAQPALLGTVHTGLNGIGAIKFDRTRVLVGELTGFAPSRAVLIDASNPRSPQILSTLLTRVAGITSIGLSGSKAVVAGTNNMTMDIIDYTNPAQPTRTAFDPALYSGLNVDLDGNMAAVGSANGPNGDVALVDITVPKVVATVKSTLVGVGSISIKGLQVVVGSQFNFNMVLLDFSVSPPQVSSLTTTLGGGWTVNRAAKHLTAGNLTGFNVLLYDLSGSSPNLLANVPTPISAPGTICVSEISPPSVVVPPGTNFGTIANNTAKTAIVSFQNNGGSQLQLTNITTNGNPNFSVSSAALTIGPNGSGSVNVKFAATSAGTFSGMLAMNTNDPSKATISVPLNGISNGNQPPTVIIPASLAFGAIRGGTSAVLPLPIQNAGSGQLVITGLSTTDKHFNVPPGQVAVNPGSTANVNVTFLPDAVASFTGKFTANTNDPATPHVSVDLSGSGTAFGFSNAVTVSPAIPNLLGQDPELAAWGSNVFILWAPNAGFGGFAGPPGPSLSVSANAGTTFNSPLVLGFPPLSGQQGAFYPQIAVQNNYVYSIWDSFDGEPMGAPNAVSLAFSTSSDSGSTFNAPATLGHPLCSGGNECNRPQIATLDSNVYAVWGDDGDSALILRKGWRIWLVSSENNGQTFTSPVDVTNGLNTGFASNPRIAVSDNNVFVTWININSAPCDPGGLLLKPGLFTPGQGVQFGTITSLNEPPTQACPPPPLTSDLAPNEQQIVSNANNFYAVWTANIGPPLPNRGVYFTAGSINSFGGISFSPPMVIGGNSGNPAVPQIALDGSNIYVVWQDNSSGAILLSTSTDGGQHWNGSSNNQPGPPLVVSNTLGPPQAPQIVAGGGNAYVVWADGTPGNACIRLAGVTATPNGPALQTSLIMNPLTTFGGNSPKIAESGGQVYVIWWDNNIMFRGSQPVSFILTFSSGQSNISVGEGVDAKTTIAVDLLSGFAQPISFSALPPTLPIGAGPIVFNPPSCLPTGTPPVCTTSVDIPTSAATQPNTYNTVIEGAMYAAAVTGSAVWNITVLDTVPPVVATQTATVPADGFLPSVPYSGSAVAWSPGNAVPTITIGTGAITLEVSARDNVKVASVSVTCSPSCGTVAASVNPSNGLWDAGVPINSPLTQLTIQAADPSGNVTNTYLNVQLNTDLDSDGISNNVDGNCTTSPPSSNVYSSSNRFGDCLLGGATSGQVVYQDAGINLTISHLAGGGITATAKGPQTQKAILQLDGVGAGKGPNFPYLIQGGSSLNIVDPPQTTTIEVTQGQVEARIGAAGSIIVRTGQKVRIRGNSLPNGSMQITITAVRGTVRVGSTNLSAGRSKTVVIQTVPQRHRKVNQVSH